MCDKYAPTRRHITTDWFNAVTATIEREMLWRGQEMNNGDLVWVQTAWAMGVEK